MEHQTDFENLGHFFTYAASRGMQSLSCENEREGEMLQQIRRLKFKAVLYGFLVDTIGTMAIALVLFSAMSAAGLSETEIAARMHGLSGLLLMFIFGLGFTLVGGYVAGRTAGREEILHGTTVAGIGLVLGLFLWDPSFPRWYEVVSFAWMIPAGAAGGQLAQQSNAKRKLAGRS